MAEFMQDKREHPYADWLRESPTSIQAIQKLQELEDKYCKSVNNTTPEMTKLLEWILRIKTHVPTNPTDALGKSIIMNLLKEEKM